MRLVPVKILSFTSGEVDDYFVSEDVTDPNISEDQLGLIIYEDVTDFPMMFYQPTGRIYSDVLGYDHAEEDGVSEVTARAIWRDGFIVPTANPDLIEYIQTYLERPSPPEEFTVPESTTWYTRTHPDKKDIVDIDEWEAWDVGVGYFYESGPTWFYSIDASDPDADDTWVHVAIRLKHPIAHSGMGVHSCLFITDGNNIYEASDDPFMKPGADKHPKISHQTIKALVSRSL